MTVKQQQCLLTYLGFDPGDIDGVPGPKTKAAADAFRQAAGLGSGSFDAAAETAARRAVAEGNMLKSADFWDEIRYFRREEFRCPCPRCGGFPEEPKEKLVRLAERVREHFNAPAVVSSGVRCPEHNREVGGAVNSRHLYGRAVDLCVRGQSPEAVAAYAGSLPECAYTYSICSGGVPTGFVHMDVI